VVRRYLVASVEVDYAFGAACENLKLMPVESRFEVKDKRARIETKLQSVANNQLRGSGWLKLREGKREGRRLEIELQLASWPVPPMLCSFAKTRDTAPMSISNPSGFIKVPAIV